MNRILSIAVLFSFAGNVHADDVVTAQELRNARIKHLRDQFVFEMKALAGATLARQTIENQLYEKCQKVLPVKDVKECENLENAKQHTVRFIQGISLQAKAAALLADHYSCEKIDSEALRFINEAQENPQLKILLDKIQEMTPTITSGTCAETFKILCSEFEQDCKLNCSGHDVIFKGAKTRTQFLKAME